MQQSQYSQKLGQARMSRQSTLRGGEGRNFNAIAQVSSGVFNSKIKNLNNQDVHGETEQIDFEKSHRSRGGQSESRVEIHDEQAIQTSMNQIFQRHSTTGMSNVGASQEHIIQPHHHTSLIEPPRNEEYDLSNEKPRMLFQMAPQSQSPRSQQYNGGNNQFTMAIDSNQESHQDVLSQECKVGIGKVSSLIPPTTDLRKSSKSNMRRPRSQGAGPRRRKFMSKQVTKQQHLMPKARSSVRDGLATFIQRSNIDVDQLSANLSQKQEKNRETNQYKRVSNINSNSNRSNSQKSLNSKSDQNKSTPFTQNIKVNQSVPLTNGPGLPRPNKFRSQKLAEHYRKESQGYKSKQRYIKMNDSDVLSPDKPQMHVVPQPHPRPQHMANDSLIQVNNFFNSNANMLGNEDTFQQVNLQTSTRGQKMTDGELLQDSQSSSKNKLMYKNSSPNFCGKKQQRITNAKNSGQYQQDATEYQSPVYDEQTGLQVSVNNIQKSLSPVGTIVKQGQRRQNKNSRSNMQDMHEMEYSTFGQMAMKNMQDTQFNLQRVHYKSDSQIAVGAHTLDEQKSSKELSRQDSAVFSPRSQQRRPGVIIRQGTQLNQQSRVNSTSTSREYGRIVRTINKVDATSEEPQTRNKSQQAYREYNTFTQVSQCKEGVETFFHNTAYSQQQTETHTQIQSFRQFANEQRPPLHADVNSRQNVKSSRKRYNSQGSCKSEPEHFQLVFMRSYVPNNKEKLPEFQDPLYFNLWDCFLNDNLKNVQERLKGKALIVNQYYEEVKYELQEYSIMTPEQKYNQNWSNGLLIFMHGQGFLKTLRQASKILQKERLLLTIQELADLKIKVIEKQQMLKDIRKETVMQTIQNRDLNDAYGDDEDSQDSDREVANLKVGLLQNIINILVQKIVLYSLQLKVYEREETQIVFEELYEEYYGSCIRRSYFNQFKIFLEQARMKRQKEMTITDHMDDYKLAQVFAAWRDARPKRIAYQKRIQNIVNSIKQRKQRQILTTLQLNIRIKVAQRLDKKLIKKFQKYKSYHQLFVRWRHSQKQINQSKMMAICIMKGQKHLNYSTIFSPLNFLACEQLMYDDFFENLQKQRKINSQRLMVVVQKIRRVQNGQTYMEDLPLQLTQQYRATNVSNLQLKTEDSTFSSFIRAQNPQAYSTMSHNTNDAMNLKKDIHALLVDAQNFYLNQNDKHQDDPSSIMQIQQPQMDTQELLKRRQIAMMRYDDAKRQQSKMMTDRLPENNYQHQISHDLPRIIDNSITEESQLGAGQKAPNQLFVKLEKKLQVRNRTACSSRQDESSIANDQTSQKQLQNMIQRIKDEIKTVSKKLLAERNVATKPGSYKRYYSFAVRYLYSRQQAQAAQNGHFSFSSQKFNNMQHTQFQEPFRQSMDYYNDQQYQDQNMSQMNESQNQSAMMAHQEHYYGSQSQGENSGFIDGNESDIYEETKRSNQMQLIQRNRFMNNNQDGNYKYISDGNTQNQDDQYETQDQSEYNDGDQQSYVESTPDKNEEKQNSYQDQQINRDQQNHFQQNQRDYDQNGYQYQQTDENQIYEDDQDNFQDRRGTNGSMAYKHAPSMSMVSRFSLTKDAYTLEDYVQMAQSRQQLPEQLQILMGYFEANNQHIYEEDQDSDQRSYATSEDNDLHTASAPERHIFAVLNIAKNIAKLFSQWRISFLQKRLDKLVNSYYNLKCNLKGSMAKSENLKNLQRTLDAWRSLPQYMDQKAKLFNIVHRTTNFYNLFNNWRDASWNVQVLINQKIIKHRQRFLLKAWQNAMSDYFQMKEKASSYHSQALCSKALLTMFIHAQRSQKLKEFRKRTIFRKFFKRTWKTQFERHRKLRVVMKIINKKSAEWERTRYQREFDKMVKAIDTWKGKVNERKRLIKNYNALSHYRSTLLIKAFQQWKKIMLVKHGLRLLNKVVANKVYRASIEKLLEITLKNQLKVHEWIKQRQRYTKQQIIVRMREHIVKKKLATMFFKRRVINKLKRYVFSKNKVIPYQFWSRYRQILFFKMLRYQVNRRRRRQQKQLACREQLQGYKHKIIIKTFQALLDHMLKNKKQFMIGQTVQAFRNHYLTKKYFNQIKLNYLNNKKDIILEKVAMDFRRDRLDNNIAFLNSQNYEHEQTLDSSEMRTKNKILLQKVYTTWLQYTLDNFIKKKVLRRFQNYQEQRLMEKVFRALKGELNIAATSNYHNSQIDHNEQSKVQFVKHHETTFRNSHIPPDLYNCASHEGSYIETNQRLMTNVEFTAPNEATNQFLETKSSFLDNEQLQQQTPCSGFIESSFGGVTPAKSLLEQENRPLILNVQTGTIGDSLDNDSDPINDNQQLFQELDEIFKKNQIWMQEQKNKQMNIFGDIPKSHYESQKALDLQQSQKSHLSGLVDSMIDESQMEQIQNRQKDLQERYKQLDEASVQDDSSSFIHTKTETQFLDQSQNDSNNYMLNMQRSKMQESQLSLISSLSSKRMHDMQQQMNIDNMDTYGRNAIRANTEEIMNIVTTSEKFRSDLLQPSQIVSSTYNQSRAIDSSLQQNRTNSSSVGISSFKRQKDEQMSTKIADTVEQQRISAPSNGQISKVSHQYKDSHEIDHMYLEQIESSKSKGIHEKTQSYSVNKEGSLLVGGLVLSGSAANLSNQDQNEEEALIYSNQSSMKNPSSYQNLKSSRPNTTITGPTITLKNHPVISIRQDSYNRLSQRSQNTRLPNADSVPNGTLNSGEKSYVQHQDFVNASETTLPQQFRRSRDHEHSRIQLINSSSNVSMCTERQLLAIKNKHAKQTAQGNLTASRVSNQEGPTVDRDCTKSSVKSLSFSDLAREMHNKK